MTTPSRALLLAVPINARIYRPLVIHSTRKFAHFAAFCRSASYFFSLFQLVTLAFPKLRRKTRYLLVKVVRKRGGKWREREQSNVSFTTSILRRITDKRSESNQYVVAFDVTLSLPPFLPHSSPKGVFERDCVYVCPNLRMSLFCAIVTRTCFRATETFRRFSDGLETEIYYPPER